MHLHRLSCCFFVATVLAATEADWRTCTSCEDVVAQYPDRVELLFSSLDLDRPELQAVEQAWSAGERARACAALLEHFAGNEAGEPYRREAGGYRLEIADKVMDDQLKASGLWFRIPRLADGGIDWSYRGPKDYDNNQMGQINRHRWMKDLLFAGLDGQGERYLVKLDEYLRDWCAHTKEHRQFLTRWLRSRWPRMSDRKLNAGIRMRDTWPMLFYSFLPRPEFKAATRILMLAAFVEHGVYLHEHHAKKGNHLMMEITGLATLAAAFPEFTRTTERLDYVRKIARRQLKRQLYPEGVQKELCQNYHSIVLRDFEHLEEIFTAAGYPADQEVREMLIKGYEHLALAMKPNGKNMFFNDTNDQSFAWLVRRRAERYGRSDWLYPLSNGTEGSEPTKGPSLMYAWSGRLVSRDDWSRDTRWSAFDIGPWGIGHAHSDKLHLSIHHGRDLLVDSGRYTYKNYMSRDPKDLRGYVRRSWGHNVILVDHQSQVDDIKEVDQPYEHWALTPAYDFALGSWKRGWFDKRKGVHQRAVFYLKGHCWVVCDRVALKRPASIQALWHLHPDCTVPAPSDLITASGDPGQGNVRIAPITDEAPVWSVAVVEGQEEPYFQGWFSPRQNEIVPSPCAIYEASGVKVARFAWLITTAIGEPSPLRGQLLEAPDGAMRVLVLDGDGAVAEVGVDFTGDNGGLTLGDGTGLQGRHAVSFADGT